MSNNKSMRDSEKVNSKSLKRKAFESKQGYSKNYSAKEKDQMGGMPMPHHMTKKDCP